MGIKRGIKIRIREVGGKKKDRRRPLDGYNEGNKNYKKWKIREDSLRTNRIKL